jgi:hypothetical protein
VTIPYISILLNVIALCNYEINHLQQATKKVETVSYFRKMQKKRESKAFTCSRAILKRLFQQFKTQSKKTVNVRITGSAVILVHGHVHCTLCIVHCALCIVHCALCIVQCALCNVHVSIQEKPLAPCDYILYSTTHVTEIYANAVRVAFIGTWCSDHIDGC